MKPFNYLLLMLLSSLLSGIAYAAPNNDTLDSAYRINQLTFDYTQSVKDATLDNNETRSACAGDRIGGSVWFRYTSVREQTLLLDTTGSDYDTVLSVWEEGNHPLTEVACGDDNAGQAQAQISFQASASRTYLINVSAFPADSGENLVFKLATLTALTNDALTNATVIPAATNINYQRIQITEGATVEAGDPVPSCSPEAGASVWYRYTPERNQALAIDTANSNYDTVLSVWTGGSGSNLMEVACNDDNGSAVQAQVRAELTGGRTYWIQIAGVNLPPPDTGALSLRITTPPPNDTIATASTIQTPLPYTATFSTSGTLSEAELQPSCGDPFEQVGSDVWFVYTPETDQSNLRVSTLPSDYNTVLAIWQDTGTELNELACNDNFVKDRGFDDVTSLITTNFNAETRYYIQVGGHSGATGNLNFSFGETGIIDFVLTKHPRSQTIAAGETATLVVDLGPRGAGLPVGTPVTYQWYQGAKGDTSTPVGTDQDTFTTPALQSTTQYWVKVSNGTGSRNSDVATITVTGTPTLDFVLTQQPQSETIAANETATLVVDLGPSTSEFPVATPVSYQWYQGAKDDTSTPVGTDQDTFTTPALQNTTQYWVKVSNGTGSRNSDVATITVTGTPTLDFVLTQQPQSETIAANETATLVVDLGPSTSELPVATPVTYQWYQGAKDDTSTPVGTDQDTFTTPALQNTTQYWVKVSNGTGSRNSDVATITVTGGSPIDPNDPTAPIEPPPLGEHNGIGFDVNLEPLATTSHFVGYLIRQSDKRIVSEVAENEAVKIGFVANIDPNHIGQQADVVLVGVYKTADFEGVYVFDGAAGEWIIWDITLEGLAAMQADVTLEANISLPLFEGELTDLGGDFTFFMGYVVKETGALFFGSEPLEFTVQTVD